MKQSSKRNVHALWLNVQQAQPILQPVDMLLQCLWQIRATISCVYNAVVL